jgi:hypothetical protein
MRAARSRRLSGDGVFTSQKLVAYLRLHASNEQPRSASSDEMQGAASPAYRDHANGFYWLTATLRQSQPHAHESYVQSDTNRGG